MNTRSPKSLLPLSAWWRQALPLLAMCLPVSPSSADDAEIVIRNDSSQWVHLYHGERGDPQLHYERKLAPGYSATEDSNFGDRWAMVHPDTKDILLTITASPYQRQLIMTDRDFPRPPVFPGPNNRPNNGPNNGNGGGDVDLTIANATDHDLAVFSGDGRYARRISSLYPRKSAFLELEPGETWSVRDPDDGRIVAEGRATSRTPYFKVTEDMMHPPAPPQPRLVNAQFINSTGMPIQLWRKGGSRDRMVTTIYPGRTYTSDSEPGTEYYFTDPGQTTVAICTVPQQNFQFEVSINRRGGPPTTYSDDDKPRPVREFLDRVLNH